MTTNAVRILVVDDDASIRTFAARALQTAGYQIVVATDGLEALDATTLWPHEAFLEKPLSIQGLLEAVSLLLHGHLRDVDKARRP